MDEQPSDEFISYIKQMVCLVPSHESKLLLTSPEQGGV